mmetsp:Transcript_36068/g.107868  ORF Transcript_36068/g.107868 Transcript_36068/m.107868 type:complete len:353 (+) Transcript_36068:500-1558(+)
MFPVRVVFASHDLGVVEEIVKVIPRVKTLPLTLFVVVHPRLYHVAAVNLTKVSRVPQRIHGSSVGGVEARTVRTEVLIEFHVGRTAVAAIPITPRPPLPLLLIQYGPLGRSMQITITNEIDAFSEYHLGMPQIKIIHDAFRAALEDQSRHDDLGHLTILISVGMELRNAVADLSGPQKVPGERLVGIAQYAYIVSSHTVHPPSFQYELTMEVLTMHKVTLHLRGYIVDVIIDRHLRGRTEQSRISRQTPPFVRSDLESQLSRHSQVGGVALDEGGGVINIPRFGGDRMQQQPRIVGHRRSPKDASSYGSIGGVGIAVSTASFGFHRRYDLLVVPRILIFVGRSVRTVRPIRR